MIFINIYDLNALFCSLLFNKCLANPFSDITDMTVTL